MARRRFNLTERIELILEAGGLCQICGAELTLSNWHADHIEAFADGGPTELANGQALCAHCNLKKGRGGMIFSPEELNTDTSRAAMDAGLDLRDWQVAALRVVLEKFRNPEKKLRRAGIVAGVGSGKTLLAMLVAATKIKEGAADRLIVSAPSVSIARGFVRAAAMFGLNLVFRLTQDGKSTGNQELRGNLPSDCHGYVTLNQSVAANPGLHRMHCTQRTIIGGHIRTLVIIDEAHHLGVGGRRQTEDEQKDWTGGAIYAFDEAEFVLAMTGTPGRSDGQMLPFFDYHPADPDDPKQFRKLNADYVYCYGQAVDDRVVRRCVFDFVEASGNVKDNTSGEDFGTVSTSGSKSKLRNSVEATALNLELGADHGAVSRILDKGVKHLKRLQAGHLRAAGLVTCENTKHADYIAALLRAMGQTVVVVHSKLDEAAAQIEAFKGSGIDWIVAVQMVAEGVSIDRLRVVCFLTRRATQFQCEQIIGRVVRIDWSSAEDDGGEVASWDDRSDASVPPGECVFVCLDKAELRKFATKIEKELAAWAWTPVPGDLPPEGEPSDIEVTDLKTKDADAVSGGQVLDQALLARLEEIRAKNPGLRTPTLDACIILGFARENEATAPTTAPSHGQRPDYNQQRNGARIKAERVCRRVCKQKGWPSEYFQKLNAYANRRAGIRAVSEASLAQLETKEAILKEFEKNPRIELL